MSVTAGELRQDKAKKADIKAIINDHLTLIDLILRAHKTTWGVNYETYHIPAIFTIRGLETIDVQRIVYSMIINSLESRGFTVRIELGKSTSKFIIMWEAKISQEELLRFDKYIYRRCINVPTQDADEPRQTEKLNSKERKSKN